MCEWLSCREWCDVELQCGGRSLPAHRAVLASASAFLRRLLLPRQAEETLTFIVLPDFDLEAMTSVLYYIYNGEVVIQKQKLEMFMDIVKAMQIFVDKQYLSKPCINQLLCPNVLCHQSTTEKSKAFYLGDSNNGSYINLKKGVQIHDLLAKYYNKYDADCLNKQSRCQSQELNLCFGEEQSTHGDRQRSSFLRDLFIETYPRNGNSNGRTSSVPAIPNVCYHGAASVLLTNANGKHLRDEEKFTELQMKTTGLSQWTISPHSLKPLCCVKNPDITNHNTCLSNIAKNAQEKTANSTCTDLRLSSDFMKHSVMNQWMDHHSFTQQLLSTTRRQESTEKSATVLHGKKIDSNFSVYRSIHFNNPNKACHSSSLKSSILNEVLESPWSPRQPNNYRPFRRRVLTKSHTSPDIVKTVTVNDNNNNIQASTQADAVAKRLSTDDIELVHPASHASTGDFKCTICDQVFTDSETLAAHTRRHSSPARYSCTECSKSFSQLRNFKYHMSIHRGTREFAATCTVCGKYFNDRGYLSSHMKIHRNRKEYKCSQCPKSFNQRVAYNMHVRIHTGIKPHVCDECGKAFSRKMLLKQHARTHSGERPYACAHCDKRFADRSNMTLHLRLHTGVKPFSCTLCPKSFTKKHHLKSHLNFHTGAKPYLCPRCKLAFTQSSNMRTHLKKCKAPTATSIAEKSTS